MFGDSCFGSSGLQEVLVPAGVREIGESAFEGCGRLREARFAEGSRLESIGYRAFMSVPAEVRLPAGVEAEW